MRFALAAGLSLAVASVIALACVGDDPETTPVVPDATVQTPAETSSPDAPPPGQDAAVDASGCAAGDLQCDPKNCGRLGRDCLGGRCVAGRCGFVELSAGHVRPNGIKVDSGYVYWSEGGPAPCGAVDDGVVFRARLDGSDRETIAAAQRCPGLPTLIGSYVYWRVIFTAPGSNFATGAIHRALRNAPRVVETVQSSMVRVETLASDGAELFFNTGPVGNEVVRRAPVAPADGGVSALVANNGYDVKGLALAGPNVYFAAGESIHSVSKTADAGAATTVSATEEDPFSIHALPGETALVWTSQRNSRLRHLVLGNPLATTLADVAPDALGVSTSFGAHVYFWVSSATAGGRVLRVPILGGAPELIGTTMAGTANLAVDATGIYVAHSEAGKIFRLALP